MFSIPRAGATTPSNNGTNLANCAHPLAGRVLFNGSCVQGTTSAADFASVRTEYGNGPGQLTAGYDIQTSYSFPFYQGDLSLGLTATIVDKFEFTETSLDGYVLDPGEDRLGFLNFATIASAASEYRGNFNVNYSQGIHNVRMIVNYVSGVEDERGAITPSGRQMGTTLAYGSTDYGIDGKDWISTDLHYTVETPWATVSASISNIADKSPPASRQEMGYDPRIGNPLGRTFEVGLRREF